jgi:predicted ArsR family transcriptional regulator
MHAADAQLFRTTRGRLLVLLCRQRQTVAELAGALGVTDNAVRAQLQRLERRRLVRQVGSRRGIRKPHAEYELTDQARELFPRAYKPVLRTLADVLFDELPATATRALLLKTGNRLFREHVGKLRGRSVRQRLAALMSVLDGSAFGIELVEESATTVVRSCSCPIASVVASHPEVCDVLARTLSKMLSADVRERCERGSSPRCCFEIEDGGRH